MRRVSRLRLMLAPLYISVALLVVKPTDALDYALVMILIALFCLVGLCYDQEYRRDEQAAADRAAAIERERSYNEAERIAREIIAQRRADVVGRER